MRAVNLTKHHGLGNDFLVLLDLDERFDGDLGELARAACDRRRGVGADGLIRVTAAGGGADVRMELHNADGGRAETSGNGIRCLVQAVVDAGVHGGPELRVATDAGVRRCTVHPESAPGVREVAVDMGTVKVGEDDPEVVEGAEGVADRAARADAGNPHLVLLVPDPAAVDVSGVGASIDRRTPGGLNVEFVRPEGPDALVMRVFERGVGETLACGTGAVAAAAVARRWGLAGDQVTVYMPGGAATVALHGDEATLTGPAERVARVELAWR